MSLLSIADASHQPLVSAPDIIIAYGITQGTDVFEFTRYGTLASRIQNQTLCVQQKRPLVYRSQSFSGQRSLDRITNEHTTKGYIVIGRSSEIESVADQVAKRGFSLTTIDRTTYAAFGHNEMRRTTDHLDLSSKILAYHLDNI